MNYLNILKMNHKLLLLGLIAIFSINVSAQNKSTRPVQLSFIYPLGTAGISAKNYSNCFSLNLLAGNNGGLKGFEIGSIYNYNKGYVIGFQLSGIANITTDSSTGLILSGVANINKEKIKGIQLSGIINTASELNGAQFSVINIVNFLRSGLQIGLVNISKRSNGFQLGVLNIADSISNVSIGLINIVKNGYYAFELSTYESIYGKFSFKMGSKKAYTIYSAGLSTYKNNFNIIQGIGIGSLIEFSPKHALAIEIESHNLTYNNNWTNNLNLLNTLKFNYQYSFNDNIKLSFSPVINSYVSNQEVNESYGSINVPYTIFQKELGEHKLSTWVGISVGLVYLI